MGNSARSSSTWSLETAVKDRLREYTGPVSPPAALKRATSFLILDFGQSGLSVAIAVVVFPAASQPRTTSTSCAFHAVPRPMEIDAKIEEPDKKLRIRWLSDQKIAPTAPRACPETLVIIFQLWQSWVSSLSTSLPSPRWMTGSQTRRCLQLPRFSSHSIFLHLRIKLACEVCPQEFHAEKSSAVRNSRQGIQRRVPSRISRWEIQHHRPAATDHKHRWNSACHFLSAFA